MLPADDLVFILDSIGPSFEVLAIKKRILGLGPEIEGAAGPMRSEALKVVRYILYGIGRQVDPSPAP